VASLLESGRNVLHSQKNNNVGTIQGENPELSAKFHKKHGFFFAVTLYYKAIGLAESSMVKEASWPLGQECGLGSLPGVAARKRVGHFGAMVVAIAFIAERSDGSRLVMGRFAGDQPEMGVVQWVRWTVGLSLAEMG